MIDMSPVSRKCGNHINSECASGGLPPDWANAPIVCPMTWRCPLLNRLMKKQSTLHIIRYAVYSVFVLILFFYNGIFIAVFKVWAVGEITTYKSAHFIFVKINCAYIIVIFLVICVICTFFTIHGLHVPFVNYLNRSSTLLIYCNRLYNNIGNRYITHAEFV